MLIKLGTVGITEHAQQLLGDVVFVELPPLDSYVSRGGIYTLDLRFLLIS